MEEIARMILNDGDVASHEKLCGIDYYVVDYEGERYVITYEGDKCIFFLREIRKADF